MNKKLLLSIFVALFSLSAYAQCPTNISDPDGDGGRYFLTLSSLAQCSTAPYNVAGTAVTLNGPANTYLTGNCTNNGNPAGPVIATIVYNAGTPIVLATSAPVTLRVGGSTCVYGSGGALPVELMSFSGKNREGGSLLTWATATEKNVRDFDIERSLDGQLFIKIGTVKANGSNSKYNFTDPTTAANVHYYRLKTNDLDGKTDYSKVITLSNAAKNQLKVYPSVTHQFLTVESPLWGLEADFQVFNLLGQQVLTGKSPSGGRGLDVSALPQGTYILKVGTEVTKFVKQ